MQKQRSNAQMQIQKCCVNVSAPVDVELTVVGEVVVDDKRHLLHVDTTSPDISSDQHSGLISG